MLQMLENISFNVPDLRDVWYEKLDCVLKIIRLFFWPKIDAFPAICFHQKVVFSAHVWYIFFDLLNDEDVEKSSKASR